MYRIYDALFNHLEDSMQRLGSKRAAWKKAIYQGLVAAKQKLQHYYQKTYGFHGIIYAVASVLDPYQKLSLFRSDNWMEPKSEHWDVVYHRVMRKVFRHYCERFPQPDVEITHSSAMCHIDIALQQSKRRRQASHSHSHDSESIRPAKRYAELEAYLDERMSILPPSYSVSPAQCKLTAVCLTLAIANSLGTTDALQWWCNNANRFPILARMARDFLAVPASSVGPENLFSTARDVCHYRRNRLAPETIEAHMIQMCSDRFALSREFEFLEDEDNAASQAKEPDNSDTGEPLELEPECFISETEDLGGFSDDDTTWSDDDLPSLPAPPLNTAAIAASVPSPAISTGSAEKQPPAASTERRPRRIVTRPGYFRDLEDGILR